MEWLLRAVHVAGLVFAASVGTGLLYVCLNLLMTSERESVSTIRDDSCSVATPEQAWAKGAAYGKSSALSDIFDVLPGAQRCRR